jgi:hypothetical protein
MGAAPCQVGPTKAALVASSPRCPQDLGVTPTFTAGSERPLPGLTLRPAQRTPCRFWLGTSQVVP